VNELNRREFLGGCASAALVSVTRTARAQSAATELETHDLELEGDRRIAQRARLLLPKHATEPLRLLVLLHGLGETGNPPLALRAWSELYGLVSSYERLRHPPLERTLERQRYLTDERHAEVNAGLVARPFAGFACVAPVTPNPHRIGPAPQTLDRYADWIEHTLLPAVRQRARIATAPWGIGLDGCSLGGYVGIEVFLRKPHLFGTFGMVQGAFGAARAHGYADRLARTLDRAGPRPLHLESSSEDPFRRANEMLSKRLAEIGIPHTLRIPPGPHNQPWLREIGTAEMLLWHDRHLLQR
jgi:hypothetical protein